MDLNEKEAYGHWEHWIHLAATEARAAVGDIRASIRFLLALRRAQDAARGIALLRSDPTWLTISTGLQPILNLGGKPERWQFGNLNWFLIADRLERIAKMVAVKFTAPALKI